MTPDYLVAVLLPDLRSISRRCCSVSSGRRCSLSTPFGGGGSLSSTCCPSMSALASSPLAEDRSVPLRCSSKHHSPASAAACYPLASGAMDGIEVGPSSCEAAGFFGRHTQSDGENARCRTYPWRRYGQADLAAHHRDSRGTKITDFIVDSSDS